MNVCIIGTGYVGLVTGTSLAYLGNNVVCVDVDADKIARLQAGRKTIYEPGIDELLRQGIEAGRLSFTTEIEEGIGFAEVIFIAVGTPSLADGNPDLQYVKSAAQSIGRSILENHTDGRFRVVVNKSTVPVGSGNWVEMLIREQIRATLNSGLRENHSPDVDTPLSVRSLLDEISTSFTVVSNPEFLREGTAFQDTFYPDRIVIGANEPKAFAILRELYRPLLEQSFEAPASSPRPEGFASVPLITTDLASAEMIKYAANAFLAMKISFANEMANICERSGADIERVAEGIGLDKRIGVHFLKSGIGWGGSCFGKDISALIEIASDYGYRPELLEATKAVNHRQRQIVIQKLQGSLRIIKGRTIGVLGLAFKPETDDVRDAPSYSVTSELVRMGAHVKVFDPVAINTFKAQHPELEVEYAETLHDAVVDCDAIVVATEWEQFKELDLLHLKKLMAGSVIIDGRHIFDALEATNAGFRYIALGRDITPLREHEASTLAPAFA